MKKPAKDLWPFLLIYALMCLLLVWLGPCNFVYMEHIHTFYYDSTIIGNLLDRPGGLCLVAGDWLVQWFYSPAAAVTLTAAVLTALSGAVWRVMRAIGGSCRPLLPLCVLPSLATALLMYNVNYAYCAPISLTLSLAALAVTNRRDGSPRHGAVKSALAGMVTAVAVYAACGAGVTVYAALFLAMNARGARRFLLSLAVPLAALVCGLVSVDGAEALTLRQVLLPQAFYSPRFPAPATLYMPWALLAAVAAAAWLYGRHRSKKSGARRGWLVACLSAAAAIVYAWMGVKGGVGTEDLAYKEANCLIRESRWAELEQLCASLPPDNLLWQNCRNLALAEQGRLADEAFRHGCYDIRSIYNTGDSSPYMAMLLSDIYYSMGHIALAQRHAFEANESFGDLSPRMLQRLVDTNIEYGHYKVAAKYLKLLSKTSRYADWAAGRQRLIDNGNVDSDPELAMKRACIFPDNRFSAYRGLDDDLLQVVRANPAHKATLQYLGTLYLLSKDLDSFRATIDEFYGTEALPGPLPEAFAQGMLVAVPDDSVAARYGLGPETLREYEAFTRDPRSNNANVWYFLKYVR